MNIQELKEKIKLMEDYDTSDLPCGDQDYYYDELNQAREDLELLLKKAEFKSVGSLACWGESDFIDEMSRQREAMGLTTTSAKGRKSIASVAFLMVICSPESFKSTAEAHRHEMEVRNNMIDQAEFFTSREAEETDPNACKKCGVNDDYAHLSGHIYCQSCGQDFDNARLNFL